MTTMISTKYKKLKKQVSKLQSQINKIDHENDSIKLEKYKKLVGKYCWKTEYVNSFHKLLQIKNNSYTHLRVDLDHYEDSDFSPASIKIIVEKGDPLFTFERLTKQISLTDFGKRFEKAKKKLGVVA